MGVGPEREELTPPRRGLLVLIATCTAQEGESDSGVSEDSWKSLFPSFFSIWRLCYYDSDGNLDFLRLSRTS